MRNAIWNNAGHNLYIGLKHALAVNTVHNFGIVLGWQLPGGGGEGGSLAGPGAGLS